MVERLSTILSIPYPRKRQDILLRMMGRFNVEADQKHLWFTAPNGFGKPTGGPK
jgi:hypothetical protein